MILILIAIPADANLLNGYALNGSVLVGYVLNGYVLVGYVCDSCWCTPFSWIRIEWIRIAWIRIGGIRVERIRIGGIRFEWICVQNLLMQTFSMDTQWMDTYWWDTCWTDTYWWDTYWWDTFGMDMCGICVVWWISVGYVWCEIRQQSSEEPCDETSFGKNISTSSWSVSHWSQRKCGKSSRFFQNMVLKYLVAGLFLTKIWRQTCKRPTCSHLCLTKICHSSAWNQSRKKKLTTKISLYNHCFLTFFFFWGGVVGVGRGENH